MSHGSDTRFLHVANGTSTTMTIEAAGLPGVCSIWADPLHEGPVPSGISDDELVDVRSRFLGPSDDPVNDFGRWRSVIARHDAYDELVLWFEHDLFDQLNLIQVLTFVREHLPPSKRVTLICIDSFPGRPDFKGLGELTASELAPLVQTRRPVAEAQFALARRAWDAFREPTPTALDELRLTDTSALPFLAPSLTRFLQEYPWTRDGLSRSERRLLTLAEDGIALQHAFPRMSEGERAYHMTDLSLLAITDALSSASPPLLAVTQPSDRRTLNARPGRVNPFEAVVRLTDDGCAVLQGRLDRVQTCGLDRWFGGVHLHGREVPWRWDDARGRVVGV